MLFSMRARHSTCAELDCLVEQGRSPSGFGYHHTSKDTVLSSVWPPPHEARQSPHKPEPDLVGEHQHPDGSDLVSATVQGTRRIEDPVITRTTKNMCAVPLGAFVFVTELGDDRDDRITESSETWASHDSIPVRYAANCQPISENDLRIWPRIFSVQEVARRYSRWSFSARRTSD